MSWWRFSLVLILTLVFSGQAFAASSRIEVEQTDFQFGTIRQGEHVEHRFLFRNSGDQPLEITKVKSSCGCTAALVDNRQLAPGEEGEVKVNFDSTRFNGNVTKTIYLYTNDPQNKLVQMHLRGAIKAELLLSGQNLRVGPVKAGIPVRSSVTLTNQGETPVKLSGLHTTIPEATASLDKEELDVGEKAVISLMVTPKLAGKNLNGYIFCNTSNKNKPQLRLPFTVLVNK